MQPPNFLTNS